MKPGRSAQPRPSITSSKAMLKIAVAEGSTATMRPRSIATLPSKTRLASSSVMIVASLMSTAIRFHLGNNRITLRSMQRPAMTVTDALNLFLSGHDVKSAAASDCDSTYMYPLFLPLRHNSLDEITGAKSLDRPRCFGRCARKSILVHPAHLPRIMTDSLDAQQLDLRRIELLRRAVTNTRRIDPMRFR